MKKINYKSFKDVYNRLDELEGPYKPYFIFRHFDNGIQLDIFDDYKDRREVLLRRFLQTDDNWDSLKFKRIKEDIFNRRIKEYIKLRFSNKSWAVKKQVFDYINILSEDADDSYFIATILAYVYDTENFKSKENSGKFATDKEKKKLLDLPLKVLKANKSNEAYKLGALYNMMTPELCEEFLFDEMHILCDLLNTSAFQHSKRNQPELDRLCEEHLKNAGR
ncbi:MAG: hypothetical protein ACI4N3_01365 [Alphaproteobacteria bacterium]